MAHAPRADGHGQALDVPQCGFCQSGMIMAADFVAQRETESNRCKDIDEAMTNICRCGTYNRVRTAIQHGGESMMAAMKTGAAPKKVAELGKSPS